MPTPALYDTDLALWAAEQARLLDEKRVGEVDLDRVARGIEGLGTRQREALQGRFAALVARLMLWKYMPGARLPSWRSDMTEERRAIARILRASSSLDGFAAAYFPEACASGRRRAAAETGIDVDLLPSALPFTLAEARDEAFMPLEPDREMGVAGP